VRAAAAREPSVRALVPVARACELLAARAGHEFTRFDGNLGALDDRLQAISPVGADRAISPTRLELWAVCPHAYFMEHVLRVEVVERPEELLSLSALDRGSIIHDVLDRFVAEAGDGPRDRARLREIGEAACADAEARGVTGRRLLWER
jgi:hypothetical protein